MKHCVNCFHYQYGTCQRIVGCREDVVHGFVVIRVDRPCYLERQAESSCGPDAKYFQSKSKIYFYFEIFLVLVILLPVVFSFLSCLL